ncbi:Zinc finger transcription factor ace1 [Pleurostoma richardsiae]|uniref:Zinc finger transcription factor ace1 n=1 Tax=Pleurostoma richardsiae TaxID=41990 RepID=A0AA38VWL2_9PEZI|nr:Zinc finger transcription factor ace1 [Pleurostoma richardsiae]
MSAAPGFTTEDGENYRSELYQRNWNTPSVAAHDALLWEPMQAAAPLPVASNLGPGYNLPPTEDDDDDDADSNSDSGEVFACVVCGKQYNRHCDLNKHSKSHVRPYKCSVETCKYSTLGWPTEKELNRHINDKHSSSPQTFACLYSPCSYKSKRESNCKQHMEKTHGWTYVRSRLLKGDTQPKDPGELSGVGESLYAGAALDSVSMEPLRDFTLYPDPGDHDALGSSNTFLNLGNLGSYGTQAFIPWTSPMTRLRKNETFLQDFTESYKTESPTMGDASGVLPIDPALTEALNNYTMTTTGSHDTSNTLSAPTSGVHAHLRLLPPLDTDVGVKKNNSSSPSAGLGTNPVYGQAPYYKVEETSTGRVSAASGKRSSGHGRMPSGQSEIIVSLGSVHDDENDDEEDEPPRKRARTETDDGFDDMEMPCPFRASHPDIYNVDNNDRYGSCHTKHKNISTIARHLGRAAHHLAVGDRWISSFDVQYEGSHRHPAAGVCRKCWRAWSDRETFDRHISQPCANASRSKREKWNILETTFCPLIGQVESPPLGDVEQPLPQTPEHGGFAHQDYDHYDAVATSRRPSNVTSVRPPADEMVTMSDHRALVERVTALEMENQRLQKAYHVIARKLHQGSAGIPAPGGNPSSSSSSGAGHQAGTVLTGLTRLPSTLTQDSRLEGSRDRDSLVGGMDSQSTDYGGHGGFEDEAAQILSRIRSMPGSEHSTIHHVPLSPSPPRPSQDAEAAGVLATEKGSQNKRSQTWPGAKRLKASVTDSGYVSQPKVDNGGGPEQAQEGSQTQPDSQVHPRSIIESQLQVTDYSELNRDMTEAEFDEEISNHELKHIDIDI